MEPKVGVAQEIWRLRYPNDRRYVCSDYIHMDVDSVLIMYRAPVISGLGVALRHIASKSKDPLMIKVELSVFM